MEILSLPEGGGEALFIEGHMLRMWDKKSKLTSPHPSPKRGGSYVPSPVRGGFIPRIHPEGLGRGQYSFQEE